MSMCLEQQQSWFDGDAMYTAKRSFQNGKRDFGETILVEFTNSFALASKEQEYGLGFGTALVGHCGEIG